MSKRISEAVGDTADFGLRVATVMQEMCVTEAEKLRDEWAKLAEVQPGWKQHVRAADAIIAKLKGITVTVAR